MALIQCQFYSEVLGLSTSMHVILPQETRSQIGLEGKQGTGPHPTLYLLHGLSDDDSIWLRRTSIERYVASLGIAVVMPQIHRSFYTNMEQGGAYGTFISEELPALARSFFPLSAKREDNFVAGLSMGGYGAFKLALQHPERFAAAASLSGVMDIHAARIDPTHKAMSSAEWSHIFGPDEIRGTDHDLLELLQRHTTLGTSLPLLYQCCGTEDFLYEGNQTFRKACDTAGIPLTYEEGPGTHEWGYWDAKIQDVLAWLPLKGR
ncbi:alpha/beta hydrolase [Paenibacillus terrae]|uniref:Esterase n=1 Tax=Paenibacillus terrae (strain HPL-003) TaxID=985665 RepID=G7VUN5_PAETH|nr:alpha/beta hydrolase family protein [Paenibacillus terrae]AET57642.1 esterase [Paenibacillus terrae HPL-003]